jgi:hypothetical protein
VDSDDDRQPCIDTRFSACMRKKLEKLFEKKRLKKRSGKARVPTTKAPRKPGMQWNRHLGNVNASDDEEHDPSVDYSPRSAAAREADFDGYDDDLDYEFQEEASEGHGHAQKHNFDNQNQVPDENDGYQTDGEVDSAAPRRAARSPQRHSASSMHGVEEMDELEPAAPFSDEEGAAEDIAEDSGEAPDPEELLVNPAEMPEDPFAALEMLARVSTKRGREEEEDRSAEDEEDTTGHDSTTTPFVSSDTRRKAKVARRLTEKDQEDLIGRIATQCRLGANPSVEEAAEESGDAMDDREAGEEHVEEEQLEAAAVGNQVAEAVVEEQAVVASAAAVDVDVAQAETPPSPEDKVLEKGAKLGKRQSREYEALLEFSDDEEEEKVEVPRQARSHRNRRRRQRVEAPEAAQVDEPAPEVDPLPAFAAGVEAAAPEAAPEVPSAEVTAEAEMVVSFPVFLKEEPEEHETGPILGFQVPAETHEAPAVLPGVEDEVASLVVAEEEEEDQQPEAAVVVENQEAQVVAEEQGAVASAAGGGAEPVPATDEDVKAEAQPAVNFPVFLKEEPEEHETGSIGFQGPAESHEQQCVVAPGVEDDSEDDEDYRPDNDTEEAEQQALDSPYEFGCGAVLSDFWYEVDLAAGNDIAAPEPVSGLLIGEEYQLQNIDMDFNEEDLNVDMEMEDVALVVEHTVPSVTAFVVDQVVEVQAAFNEAAAMDLEEFGAEDVAMLESMFDEGCMELEDQHDVASSQEFPAYPSLATPFQSVFGGFAAMMAATATSAEEVPVNAAPSVLVPDACVNIASATSIDLLGQSTSNEVAGAADDAGAPLAPPDVVVVSVAVSQPALPPLPAGDSPVTSDDEEEEESSADGAPSGTALMPAFLSGCQASLETPAAELALQQETKAFADDGTSPATALFQEDSETSLEAEEQVAEEEGEVDADVVSIGTAVAEVPNGLGSIISVADEDDSSSEGEDSVKQDLTPSATSDLVGEATSDEVASAAVGAAADDAAAVLATVSSQPTLPPVPAVESQLTSDDEEEEEHVVAVAVSHPDLPPVPAADSPATSDDEEEEEEDLAEEELSDKASVVESDHGDEDEEEEEDLAEEEVGSDEICSTNATSSADITSSAAHSSSMDNDEAASIGDALSDARNGSSSSKLLLDVTSNTQAAEDDDADATDSIQAVVPAAAAAATTAASELQTSSTTPEDTANNVLFNSDELLAEAEDGGSVCGSVAAVVEADELATVEAEGNNNNNEDAEEDACSLVGVEISPCDYDMSLPATPIEDEEEVEDQEACDTAFAENVYQMYDDAWFGGFSTRAAVKEQQQQQLKKKVTAASSGGFFSRFKQTLKSVRSVLL